MLKDTEYYPIAVLDHLHAACGIVERNPRRVALALLDLLNDEEVVHGFEGREALLKAIRVFVRDQLT